MKHSSLVPALSFATLCLFIAAGCSQKSTSHNSATSKPKTNRPAPDFTVSATDLYKEWKADHGKAGDKYEGKQIAVTGRLKVVVLTPMMVPLAAGERDLVGRFDEEERERVAALKTGQNVTMQCLGGTSWPFEISLEHCSIVNVD